jgi:protocatechuate 3,4-dioxygenase beta subunit
VEDVSAGDSQRARRNIGGCSQQLRLRSINVHDHDRHDDRGHEDDRHKPGHDHDRDHDRGLGFDLATLRTRRHALRLIAGAGAAVLVGCGSSGDGDGDAAGSSTSSQSSTSSSTADPGAPGAPADGGSATDADDAGEIPEETAGPYPGDGSNGPNVLAEDGIVRSDITSSFGGPSRVAEGVPLAIDLVVVDGGTGEPIPGAAVYVWHCDRDAGYSLYSDGVTAENYLRGVQVADDGGAVGFTSIFPACYDGRWPHVHFEVYGSLDEATGGGEPVKTSQLALPEDVCRTVYASEGYEQSVTYLNRVALATDMVFSDGYDLQLATVTGSVGGGYVASLDVPV